MITMTVANSKKQQKGMVRRYSNGIWQGSIYHKEGRYYAKAESRGEAEQKIECMLRFCETVGSASNETLDQYLKENGFPAGTQRKVVSSTYVKQLSKNAWRVVFRYFNDEFYIGAKSEEEAHDKLNLTLKCIEDGKFLATNENLHEILLNAGYSAGRFSAVKDPVKKREGRNKPFENGIRQRADGLFEGRYYYANKQHSIYGATRKETAEKLTVIKASISNGSYIEKSSKTLADFFMYWLNEKSKSGLSPATETSYRNDIINHIIPCLGNKKIQQITTEDIQDFFNAKTIGGRADGKEGGLNYKKRINLRNMMSMVFNYAVYPKKILKSNPIINIDIKYERGNQIPVLTQAETNYFIDYALKKETPYGWAVVILLKTGLRIGEFLGMKIDCVDMINGALRVEKSLRRLYHPNKYQKHNYERVDLEWARKGNKTGLYLGAPKTASSIREFPISDVVIQCIEKLIAHQEKLLGHPIKQIGSTGNESFVFVNEFAHPADPKVFHDHFKALLHEANMKNIKVHSTRHTFITNAINRFPEQLANISAIAGHANQATTLRYNHQNQELMVSMMKSM